MNFSFLIEDSDSRRKVSRYGVIRYFDNENKLHRVDGPAVIGRYGGEWWYLHGKRHRTDGPAIKWSDGREEFWVRGKQMSRKEFEKHFEIKSKE